MENNFVVALFKYMAKIDFFNKLTVYELFSQYNIIQGYLLFKNHPNQ